MSNTIIGVWLFFVAFLIWITVFILYWIARDLDKIVVLLEKLNDRR